MMEQHPGMEQPQIPAEDKIDVGAVLREAREQAGMSVEDVANRLKFAPRQITALEEGDFAQLPQIAFIRGFVRSYARLLQLDEMLLLDALPGGPARQQVAPVGKKSVGEPFPGVYALRKTNILWLAAALGVALIIGWLAFTHKEEQAAPQQLAESKPPESRPVAELAIASQVAPASAVIETEKNINTTEAPAHLVHIQPGKAVLQLVFDEDSWVEVKDESGTVLLSMLGLRGSEHIVNKIPPYAIVIGHAQGVKLYFKGKQVDLAPYTKVDVARLTLK